MTDCYLTQRCEDSLNRLGEQRHRSFARAIRDSIAIDIEAGVNGRQIPNVCGAFQIENQYRFNFRDQKNYGISLTRPEAYEFLRHYTSIGRETFRKNYTATAFEKKYHVQPAFYSRDKRQILLTYAQWIHFLDLKINITLPACLGPFFRSSSDG